MFGISFRNKVEYMPKSEMRAASDRIYFISLFVIGDLRHLHMKFVLFK